MSQALRHSLTADLLLDVDVLLLLLPPPPQLLLLPPPAPPPALHNDGDMDMVLPPNDS